MKKQLRKERLLRKGNRPKPLQAPALEPAAVPIQFIERAAVDWDNPQPGQAWWSRGGDYQIHGLNFFCPGGCGDPGFCRVGNGKKPEVEPSWKWDGNEVAPTLEPSIYAKHTCGWHGYLTAGVFKAIKGEKNQCRGARD